MPIKQENVQISNVVNFKDNIFELFIFEGNNSLVFLLVYSKTDMVFQTSALGLWEYNSLYCYIKLKGI